MMKYYKNMLKFSEYHLNEKIYLKKETTEASILFMDLVKSSEKWVKDEESMLDVLSVISELFDKYVIKYNGLIVKSIGDAYMMKFDTLYDSVDFALFIQNELKENPIKFKNQNIQFRIGICEGNVYEIEQDIQNFKLVDYLGNTVGSASRVESKVAEDGQIAFATMNKKKDKKLDKLLSNYKVDMVIFNNKGNEQKRSFRLLSDIQKFIFKNVKELKGVSEIDVYKIKI